MKPAAFPALRVTRLLDQVRERIRYKHYSLRTEQAYVQWVKVFVKWSGLRHPRDMGEPEVEAFLTMVAVQRKAPASTHNQALSALLFPYREVLAMDLPWMDGIKRPAHTKRIPSVLTKGEVAGDTSHQAGLAPCMTSSASAGASMVPRQFAAPQWHG